MEGQKDIISLKPGMQVSFSKTILEKDIQDFAQLTGDFSPNHMDEDFMKASQFGRKIAHGALLVGYMSAASSMIIKQYASLVSNYTPVSLGYDRIRFIKPVFIGERLNVSYKVQRYDSDRKRYVSDIKITNQDEILVALATHILKWVPN